MSRMSWIAAANRRAGHGLRSSSRRISSSSARVSGSSDCRFAMRVGPDAGLAAALSRRSPPPTRCRPQEGRRHRHRGRRERAGDVRILAGRDGTWRAVLQQLLHAADRVSVLIQPLPDPAQQPDVFGSVIAPAAAAFHGPELRKLRLPETQHMRRKIEFVGSLSDRAKRGGAFLRPSRRRSGRDRSPHSEAALYGACRFRRGTGGHRPPRRRRTGSGRH